MSDFRNYDYRNPQDPLRSDPQLDPNVRAAKRSLGVDCRRDIPGGGFGGGVRLRP